MTVWYTHSKRQRHKTFSETHTSGTAFHTHVYNVQKSLYHQVDISSTLYTQWQKGLQLIKSASPKQFQALRMDPGLSQTTKCFYCSSPTALLSLVAIEVSQGVPKSGTLLDGIFTCSVSNFHFRSKLFCCFVVLQRLLVSQHHTREKHCCERYMYPLQCLPPPPSILYSGVCWVLQVNDSNWNYVFNTFAYILGTLSWFCASENPLLSYFGIYTYKYIKTTKKKRQTSFCRSSCG